MVEDYYANYYKHLNTVLKKKPELSNTDKNKPFLNYKGIIFSILRNKKNDEITTKEMSFLLKLEVKRQSGTLVEFESKFVSSSLNKLVKEGRATKRKEGRINKYRYNDR